MGKMMQWLGFEDVPQVRSSSSPTPAGETVMPHALTPPSRSAGPVLTVDTAVGIIPVYRALNIISTAAYQLTLDAYRGNEPLVPAPAIIRKPDPLTDQPTFTRDTVVSLASTGNAYWRLESNDREYTSAQVLNPWECEPLADGTLAWRDKVLKPHQFRHLTFLRMPGQLRGLGPIQAARAQLQGALDLSSYASGWFASGDVPTGILKTDQVLTSDQAELAKLRWQTRQAHEVAVLGNGLDYQPVLLSPEDAQFLQTQQFSVTQVAALFGIPAHLMLAAVQGGSQTYANIGQADLSFARWTLMGYLRPIELAASTLVPSTTNARYNLDALLRPDTKTRYEAHAIGIQAGFLTVDDVRRIEGLA